MVVGSLSRAHRASIGASRTILGLPKIRTCHHHNNLDTTLLCLCLNAMGQSRCAHYLTDGFMGLVGHRLDRT